MFWGDGGKEKRRINIPAPGVVINGKLYIGPSEVTYGTLTSAMAMLSQRIDHELTQRLGRKDAELVINLGAAQRASELF